MLITLFAPKAPTINGFEFDAVLEDDFEAQYETTEYVIEAGANASDHRIIQPRKYSLVGVMSNTPLTFSATALIGGALSNISPNSAIFATTAGVSAGILAGSEQTRASAALKAFLDLADSGEELVIAAGDVTLFNQVVKSVRRTRTPVNENGIELVIELEELSTLSVLDARLSEPKQSQLREGDPAQSQASALVDKGQVLLDTATLLAISQITTVLQ